jgi:PAS domain S-box-containing protein
LAVLDLRGKILFSNAALRGMIGQKESAPTERYFQDLLPQGGKLFYETQFIPTLLLRGTIAEISFELLGPDEMRIPVLINGSLTDGHEQIFLAVFSAKQRRLYEKELLRARKEFEQVAEVVRRSSDAILRLTADGIVQSWNDGASQIFRLAAEEGIGKHFQDLFEVDDAGLTAAMAKLAVGKEAFVEGRRTGTRTDLSVSMTPHMEAPGMLVAFSAIIRDISSRKLAERAILQNEKLASVGRLASSIAHEINNPLEAVTNLLFILQSRVTDEETKALVTTAQKELDRVTHIATHTLRFHKQSTHRTEVDFGPLGESVIALYRLRLENSGIAVISDCTASAFLFFEGELRQILFNLVANAFDAMRGGGRLILRCRDVTLHPSGQKGVRITVADNGAGMGPEILKQIFEPFFSTKGIGGTGLGLWITEDLVRKNGGTIRIRSSNRTGRSGTVVMMVFPHPPS